MSLFKIKTQEIPRLFLLAMNKKKKILKCAHDGACCPIRLNLLRLKSGQLITNQI